ncbi:MAG: hypothetical protein K0Q95_1951 [Bacteroidota bacterium]|jgi:hypothetical protein|nr:hypothetical protein [Bacteroidota bacterium]
MKRILISGTILTAAALACLSFRSEPQLPEISVPEGQVKELPMMNNDAFKRGEQLSFRVHYGIMDAGTATLTVTDEEKNLGGRKTFHIVGLGQSKGTFDWFFKVRDRYETYIDEKALVPWLFVRRISEGGYKCEQDYIFNHFSEKVNVGDGKVFPIEPNMQDMLSAFYQARNLDLSNAKPGQLFSLKCFVDNEIWPLQIKFIGRETVETDAGTFKCLKFRPIVQKGRVFKKEEDLNVWISDDKNHIPVKGQADILVGSIKMELQSFSGLANPVSKVN